MFCALLTTLDGININDYKELPLLENNNNIAEKLLRGCDKLFMVYRNNMHETVCGELKQMVDVVDKFIETRSEAIKDVVTSIKQTDIKMDD